jgi:hypothetical protein
MATVQNEIVNSAEPIRNKVAESGLMTLDLAPYIPSDSDIAVFDLKPFLFMEMILKEKDYRAALQSFDWSVYENKHTGIICSVDAIIPVWAFMLAAAYLQPLAASVHFAGIEDVKTAIITRAISQIDTAEYIDKRVVIKGCGDLAIPHSAYVSATAILRPVVKSLMYGEPCSTVPIYKQARQ